MNNLFSDIKYFFRDTPKLIVKPFTVSKNKHGHNMYVIAVSKTICW